MRPSAEAPESVSRITDVGFFSLNSSTWDTISGGAEAFTSNGGDYDEYNPRDTYSYTNPQPIYEHPCSSLMKILSTGTFYYARAPQWDISSRLGKRISKGKLFGSETISYDERYLWNEYIVRCLLDFREKLDPVERQELDQCQFVVRSKYQFHGASPLTSLRSWLSKATLVFSRSRYPHHRRMECLSSPQFRLFRDWVGNALARASIRVE